MVFPWNFWAAPRNASSSYSYPGPSPGFCQRSHAKDTHRTKQLITSNTNKIKTRTKRNDAPNWQVRLTGCAVFFSLKTHHHRAKNGYKHTSRCVQMELQLTFFFLFKAVCGVKTAGALLVRRVLGAQGLCLAQRASAIKTMFQEAGSYPQAALEMSHGVPRLCRMCRLRPPAQLLPRHLRVQAVEAAARGANAARGGPGSWRMSSCESAFQRRPTSAARTRRRWPPPCCNSEWVTTRRAMSGVCSACGWGACTGDGAIDWDSNGHAIAEVEGASTIGVELPAVRPVARPGFRAGGRRECARGVQECCLSRMSTMAPTHHQSANRNACA